MLQIFFLLGNIFGTGFQEKHIFILQCSLFPSSQDNGRDTFMYNATYILQFIESMHRLGKKDFFLTKKKAQRVDMTFLQRGMDIFL